MAELPDDQTTGAIVRLARNQSAEHATTICVNGMLVYRRPPPAAKRGATKLGFPCGMSIMKGSFNDNVSPQRYNYSPINGSTFECISPDVFLYGPMLPPEYIHNTYFVKYQVRLPHLWFYRMGTACRDSKWPALSVRPSDCSSVILFCCCRFSQRDADCRCQRNVPTLLINKPITYWWEQIKRRLYVDNKTPVKRLVIQIYCPCASKRNPPPAKQVLPFDGGRKLSIVIVFH